MMKDIDFYSSVDKNTTAKNVLESGFSLTHIWTEF